MEEFSGDVDDDDDEEEDDHDEVDRYIITKISFSKDDTILEWWNKHPGRNYPIGSYRIRRIPTESLVSDSDRKLWGFCNCR